MSGILVIALVGARLLGSQLLQRLGLLILAILGLFLVAVPDTTTNLARFLGVGRGTDLLLYVSIVAGGYVSLMLYAKIRRLEAKLTEFVRTAAIHGAIAPPEDK